ncbi:PREDICTED: apolipoprotein C-I [Miniopterus natalensis]|uniref:apolipoprotein C-I n=1 Tax=Miniopterus natalensis TaxID=291302 RepID=UPI0007A6F3DA|nr:PREDICTED: apolipoprotein C-I [Miniopterus natalensis]
MRLILSLPVLVVALLMLLEGPAPSEAAPSFPEKLKEFGSTVKDKVLETIKHIKQSEFPEKTCHTVEMVPGRGGGSKLGGRTDLGP